MPGLRHWMIGTLGVLVVGPSVLAAAPLAVFECTDYISHDWARTMVTYPLQLQPGQAKLGQVKLIDEQGSEQPCQLWQVELHKDGSVARARVSFMAELKKDASYKYQLVPGRPAASAPAAKITDDGRLLTLDNGAVGIRLPKAGRIQFDKPLSFGADHAEMLKVYGGKQAAAGIAPGPLQGIRLLDGRWVGGSYFYASKPQTAPKVLACDCRIVEQGPVFTEARIRYALDGERYYQFAARLLAGDPAIRIDEQFDFKHLLGSQPDDDYQVVMSFAGGWQTGGWKPDSAFWERYSYGSALKTHKIPLETRLKELGFDFTSRDMGTHHVTYGNADTYIFGLEPWVPWGTFAGYFGLVESAKVDKLENTSMLAVVPMHAGSWRMDGPHNQKQFMTHKEGDAAMHWPLYVERHPNSIIHTGEYDPTMPWTFCRRIYAIIGGPLQTFKTLHAFRSYEGYINLDNYKDWILDWPSDPRVTYPRLFFSAADVARIKPQLDKHPAAPVLKTLLYFNDDPKRRDEMYKAYSGPRGPFGKYDWLTLPDLTYYFTLFRQAHGAEQWIAPMDELLGCPSLTVEQRQTLRRRIAAFCHMASEPDFNPRGTMSHLGNPNMPINRFLCLSFAAPLVPDHPRAKDWLDVSEQYVRYKLASNVAPGGAWSELFSYYDASAPALIHAANILRCAGRCSDKVADLAVELGVFPLRFLAPKDPRFGVRLVPNWGHEGRNGLGQWLPTAGLTRHKSPETARQMLWAWDQIGRLAGFHDVPFNVACVMYADLLGQIRPGYVPSGMSSSWYPGVGATMRSHATNPNETYLSYRQGYMISHCDYNQGDFVLHAKGAPLVDMSLFAYNLHNNEKDAALNKEFGWYSTPRFGKRDNVADVRGGGEPGAPGVWNPSSEIHAHSFSDSADYLRGHSDNHGRRWTRQILFLKGKAAAGPNYFLFRDSTDSLSGNAKDLVQYWWNFRTVGVKDQVAAAADEINYTSKFGPKLNVRFLQPAKIHCQSRDETREGPNLRPSDTWRKDGEPFTMGEQSVWGKIRDTFTVTAVGPIPAGQDALVSLYPQTAAEAAPKYESLADGVARITTSEGADYVFLDRKPLTFQKDDVAFTGIAGAVRVYPNEVHLVIAEGPGEVRYKSAVFKSASPATKVIPAGNLARPQTTEIPLPRQSITFTLESTWRVEQLQPGVKKGTWKDGYAYAFDSDEPLKFDNDGVVFHGRRGGVVVDNAKKTVRLVMLDGQRIAHQNHQAWGCNGPYDVTYSHDRIAGRYSGLGRFLCLVQPPGVDRMASLILDGQTYAPGTSGSTLVVPLMPGEHQFEIKNLEQPPVWRSWQLW